MAKETKIKLRDRVYFLKRPIGCKEKIDKKGEWIAGAGKVMSIITKKGERRTDPTPVEDVAAVRILPYVDANGDHDIVEAEVGEFTYSLENFLLNLTA